MLLGGAGQVNLSGGVVQVEPVAALPGGKGGLQGINAGVSNGGGREPGPQARVVDVVWIAQFLEKVQNTRKPNPHRSRSVK